MRLAPALTPLEAAVVLAFNAIHSPHHYKAAHASRPTQPRRHFARYRREPMASRLIRRAFK